MSSRNTNEIATLIVDDHLIVRDALRDCFRGTEIKILGEAASGAEAVRMVAHLDIDVVLLDIEMPDGNGLEALRQIKEQNPQVAVLMHSCHVNPNYVKQSLVSGASGYLMKGTARSQLVRAIRIAKNGGFLKTIRQKRGEAI